MYKQPLYRGPLADYTEQHIGNRARNPNLIELWPAKQYIYILIASGGH